MCVFPSRRRCVFCFPPSARLRRGRWSNDSLYAMAWVGVRFKHHRVCDETFRLLFFPLALSLLMLPPCVRVFFSDASPVGNFRPRRCCRHVDPAASIFFPPVCMLWRMRQVITVSTAADAREGNELRSSQTTTRLFFGGGVMGRRDACARVSRIPCRPTIRGAFVGDAIERDGMSTLSY